MENKTVGITGPISEINFGDYAMLINNLYDLGVKNVIIFSYNSGFSKQIVDEYLLDFNVEIIEIYLNTMDGPKASEVANKVGYLPFNFPTVTPIDVMYNIKNIDELKKKISEIDLLLVNGGGYFNHLWNNSLWRSSMLQKIIAPILVANQQNKKIVFTGNGIGPFEQSEEFFNYFFNYLKAPVIAVRDRMYSSVYLKRIGYTEDKINFIPDDLYIINSKIINLPLKQTLNLDGRKYIILELYYSLEELEMYMDNIKEFSKQMFEKYKLSIVFVPFDFDRGGMWQGELLSKELKNFYLYDLNNVGYLPIQDLIQLIKGSELVVCSRYHALVLSIGNAVPVVNTIKKVCDDHRYYLNKNYGLLEYAFENINFDELKFLKIDFLQTLEFISNNFKEIIDYQKTIFESNVFLENKNKLREIRNEYIEKNVMEYIK